MASEIRSCIALIAVVVALRLPSKIPMPRDSQSAAGAVSAPVGKRS